MLVHQLLDLGLRGVLAQGAHDVSDERDGDAAVAAVVVQQEGLLELGDLQKGKCRDMRNGSTQANGQSERSILVLGQVLRKLPKLGQQVLNLFIIPVGRHTRLFFSYLIFREACSAVAGHGEALEGEVDGLEDVDGGVLLLGDGDGVGRGAG